MCLYGTEGQKDGSAETSFHRPPPLEGGGVGGGFERKLWLGCKIKLKKINSKENKKKLKNWKDLKFHIKARALLRFIKGSYCFLVRRINCEFQLWLGWKKNILTAQILHTVVSSFKVQISLQLLGQQNTSCKSRLTREDDGMIIFIMR